MLIFIGLKTDQIRVVSKIKAFVFLTLASTMYTPLKGVKRAADFGGLQ